MARSVLPRRHRRGDLVSLSYSLHPPRSFVPVHLTVCQGRFRSCRKTHASPLIGVTAEMMAYTFWQRSCRFQSFFFFSPSVLGHFCVLERRRKASLSRLNADRTRTYALRLQPLPPPSVFLCRATASSHWSVSIRS